MTVIHTFTGKFSLLDPQPEDVNIEDIVHALSRICRYNGHCRHFYSVAQHSYLVSYLVDVKDKYRALLHDAGEAYYGDIVTPLKIAYEQRIGDSWRDIINGIDIVIALALGLQWPLSEEVMKADRTMLATEKRDLLPPGDWPGLSKPAYLTVVPLETRVIEPIFKEAIYAHFHNY